MNSLEISLLLNIRTVATLGDLMFLSIVIFGMKEFQVSASGAIQGHHGPLILLTHFMDNMIKFKTCFDSRLMPNSYPAE